MKIRFIAHTSVIKSSLKKGKACTRFDAETNLIYPKNCSEEIITINVSIFGFNIALNLIENIVVLIQIVYNFLLVFHGKHSMGYSIPELYQNLNENVVRMRRMHYIISP